MIEEADSHERKEKFWAQVQDILKHKKRVRDNCNEISEELAEQGEFQLSLSLIVRGQDHDDSKFSGIEFDYLHDDDTTSNRRKIAIAQHNLSNDHHPEYWGGIQNMPRICIAEMVCDWAARASEFGTSLRDWIEEDATKRFNFKKGDKVYKEIMLFVDMLCDKPFKQPKK